MKSLDALERLYIAGRLDLPYVMNGQQQKDYGTIEKCLKALEIIRKKHQLNFDIIRCSKDFYEYTDFHCFKAENCDLLTKEEYGLLKGIVL